MLNRIERIKIFENISKLITTQLSTQLRIVIDFQVLSLDAVIRLQKFYINKCKKS